MSTDVAGADSGGRGGHGGRGGREQRLVFGEVAELYDRARPSYPAALIDDLLELVDGSGGGSGAARRGARAVDVGCGTGKATVLLAERGLGGVGVEPDEAMAAVARRNLAAFPGWEVVVSGFEAWEGPAGTFDLVTSAQAWHWVDPDARIRRAHRLLRTTGGWLALFWNRPAVDPELRRRLDAAYERWAPSMTSREPGAKGHPPSDMPAATGFGEPVDRTYSWRATYTGTEYVDLLQTQSDHRMLPDSIRGDLLGDVLALVGGPAGIVEVTYRTHLWAAPRLS